MKQPKQNIELNKEQLAQLETLLSLISGNQNLKRAPALLLSELVERDIRINKDVFSKSHIEGIKAAAKHLEKYFGNIEIDRLITKQNILNYRIYYLKTLKNKTYWHTLQSIFQRALELNLIPVNYFNEVRLPKTQQKEPIKISEIELNKILSYLCSPFKEIVIFLVNTGLRVGELTNLKWNDINLAENYITVGKSFVTKTRKTRLVPLNTTARQILESRLPKILKLNHKDKYVFSKKNGYKYTTDRISKVFKRACRKAKVNEEIHLHSLRATFCSNLLQSGCTLYKASLILGHTSIETTRKYYSSMNIQSLKEAVNLLNN